MKNDGSAADGGGLHQTTRENNLSLTLGIGSGSVNRIKTMGQIGVIGAGNALPEEYETARTVGNLIAENHEILVCGGLFGVMEAACKGARERKGSTIGIVPDTSNGNQYLDVVIRTGLGIRPECDLSPSLPMRSSRSGEVTGLSRRLPSR